MSDEVIDQMVAAGHVAVSPAVQQAYDKADAEVGVLAKLWGIVTGEPEVADNRQRGVDLLERLHRPVLIDIAVAIVHAIDDAAAGSPASYVVTEDTLQALPIQRDALARNMGLERDVLDLTLAAMMRKLAQLVEQQECPLVVDGRTINLMRPPAVTQEQETAVAALEIVARGQPTNVSIVEPLAELYLVTGRLAAAAKVYGDIAMVAEKQSRTGVAARLWRGQGMAYELINDVNAACIAFETALRVDPTDMPSLTRLGRLYILQESWGKARTVYQQLVHVGTAQSRADAISAVEEVQQRTGPLADRHAHSEPKSDVFPGYEKVLEMLVAAEQLGHHDR